MAQPAPADVVRNVAGWTLEDTGRQSGDDSDRSVRIYKVLTGVAMYYFPSPGHEGVSFSMKFLPCEGLTFNSGFDFGTPPRDHAMVVREEVAEAYQDFAKRCKTAPEPIDQLLQGFPEALHAIEQQLKDSPSVYPPEPAPEAAPSSVPPEAKDR